MVCNKSSISCKNTAMIGVSILILPETKIIFFNKAGRLSKSKFNFANVELECVSEYKYKYLVVSFCSSGSFSFAQKQLY